MEPEPLSHDPADAGQPPARAPGPGSTSWWPVVLVAAAAALFVVGVMSTSTRLAQSFHGLFHGSLITQLAQGQVPPGNPLSLGAPTSYFWIWHALVALVTRVAGTSWLVVVPWINGVLLAVFVAAGAWVVGAPLVHRSHERAEAPEGTASGRAWRRALCGLLPLAVLNPLGPLVALLERAAVTSPTSNALRPVAAVLGVALDGRAGSPLAKFCNVSAMPAGMGLFALLLALLLQGGARRRLTGLVALLLGLVYPPALAGSLAALVAVGWRVPEARARVLRAGLGWLAAVPLTLVVARGFGDSGRLVTGAGLLSVHLGSVGWALVPSGLGLVTALLRWRSLAPRGQALALVTGALGTAGLLLHLPDGIHYKFVLFAAVPTAALWVELLAGPLRRGPAGVVVLGILVSTTVGAVGDLYLRSAWAGQDPWQVHEGVLDLSPGDAHVEGLREAYAWLREHTPPGAAVLERPVGMNAQVLANVAARRTVAGTPGMFTAAVPHQAWLAETVGLLVQRLAAGVATDDDLARLAAVPVAWPEVLWAVVRPRGEDRAAWVARLPRGVEPVHDAGPVAVLAVRLGPPPGGAPAIPGGVEGGGPEGAVAAAADDGLDPQGAARVERARDLQRGGDHVAALALLEPVLAGAEPDVLFLAGWSAQRQGLWERAEGLYRQALVGDPALGQVWFNLGHLLLTRQRHAEALEPFTRALDLDARRFHAGHHWLARAYRELGRLEEARREEALARLPP